MRFCRYKGKKVKSIERRRIAENIPKIPNFAYLFYSKIPSFYQYSLQQDGTAVSFASFLRLRLEDDGEYVGNEKLNYFAS